MRDTYSSEVFEHSWKKHWIR